MTAGFTRCQKVNINIGERYFSLHTEKKKNEIFTTYCANKNTFFLLNIRDEENERSRNNHLLKKKMWVELTKI